MKNLVVYTGFLHFKDFYRKGEDKVKKFNQMTEKQMSRVDGGFAIGVLVAIIVGTAAAGAGVVGATVGIGNATKNK